MQSTHNTEDLLLPNISADWDSPQPAQNANLVHDQDPNDDLQLCPIGNWDDPNDELSPDLMLARNVSQADMLMPTPTAW